MPKCIRPLALLLVLVLANSTFAAPTTSPASVQQWDIFELSLPGPADGDPFDTKLSAKFTNGDTTLDATGFYDGDGTYRIRCMPTIPGTWKYVTTSDVPVLADKRGEFVCEKPAEGNHGPVHVAHTYHFDYADGTPFRQLGTTSYGWVHQNESLEDQTLASLKASPFNKIRMCILPTAKGADHPIFVPFLRRDEKSLDFTQFDVKFWQHLEKRVGQLRDQNVEADLILFHPYRAGGYGFEQMDPAACDRYLKYVVARLGAYRNVWWSLANEFDLMRGRTPADWERYFHIIEHDDPYAHLRSIHFSRFMYDPRKPWVTHNSVQNGNAVADFGRATLYRDAAPKPVVYDEVCYEGDIDARWGMLTGEELTFRFWFGTIGGTYVGHSESFKAPEGMTWLSRGGKFTGESWKRIAYLKEILDSAPKEGIEPLDRYFRDNVGGKAGEYYLYYFGPQKPTEWPVELYKDRLADGMKFEADVLDTWNMKTTHVEKLFTLKKHNNYTFRDQDEAKIELPGKQWMAIRLKRVP